MNQLDEQAAFGREFQSLAVVQQQRGIERTLQGANLLPDRRHGDTAIARGRAEVAVRGCQQEAAELPQLDVFEMDASHKGTTGVCVSQPTAHSISWNEPLQQEMRRQVDANREENHQ